MSATARDSPLNSGTSRQFQSFSNSSQSCKYEPCTARIRPTSPLAMHI